MSDKYIIRNCPAYIHRPLSTHDRVCLLGDKVKPNHKELYVYCKDCTDCILKQIVKITKNYNKGCGKHCDINRKENNCGKTCNAYKIRQILELLDIQEVK